MRYAVVTFNGDQGPALVVSRGEGLARIDAPPSLRCALEKHGPAGLNDLARRATGPVLSLSQVKRWHPPVPNPRSFRDFYAFEQHVKTARAHRGQEMIPEWYEIAIFYFSNPSSLKGHLEPVKKPAATKELDYELEVAAVIGVECENVREQAADDAIFGYMVLNDWSARDLQRQEMKCMLGPAKGKDFATSCGPYVVTKDELEDVRVGPGKYNLTMLARRNGRELSRGNFRDLTHDFTKMIERASADVRLYPGEIIGSGTVGTGCILELRPENAGGWLRPGETLELEIERLGTLTTPIV